MDKYERALKIMRWARNRYTVKGRLTTHIGMKPTTYTRTVNAAIDKYVLEITEMSATTVIDNFINGNIKDAKAGAKKVSSIALINALKDEYGYSDNKAYLTAHYLKTGECYQQACDAE